MTFITRYADEWIEEKTFRLVMSRTRKSNRVSKRLVFLSRTDQRRSEIIIQIDDHSVVNRPAHNGELKRPRYVDNVYAAIESKCLLFWSHPFVSEARKLGERDIPAVCDVPSSWTDISGRFSYRRFVARRDLQDPRWDLGEADKFEDDDSLKDVSKFSYVTYLFLRKFDDFLKYNSETNWHFVIENYVIDGGMVNMHRKSQERHVVCLSCSESSTTDRLSIRFRPSTSATCRHEEE